MIENLSILFDITQTHSIFLYVSTWVFGLMIGSFLNVVIYRFPIMLKEDWHQQCLTLQGKKKKSKSFYNLLYPSSCCTHCDKPISPFDNIPLISFILLKGRCRSCRKMISIRYPLIEMLTGVLFAFASFEFGFNFLMLYAWIFISILIVLTWIDIDTQLLPDELTLLLLWLGLFVNLRGNFVDLSSAVIGAIVGYLILWSIFWVFKIITKKEGMGHGDFKLLAAMGAWMGWQSILPITLLSSLIGSAMGVGMILLKKHQKSIPIPFGPFLCFAGLIYFFYGYKINHLLLFDF